MKKKVSFFAALMLIIGIFLMPVRAYADNEERDFGNIAGDSDFDYDSIWEVATTTEAVHNSPAGDSPDNNTSLGCFPLDKDMILLFIIVFAVVIVLGIILMSLEDARNKRRACRAERKKKREEKQKDPSHQLKPIEEYLQVDPSFSPSEFTKRISELYPELQEGWQKKDISSFRRCLTDTFYAQMERELSKYRSRHQTNHIERISIEGCDILGWRQDGGKDMIIVQLRTKIVDYVTDDVTGEIVRGYKTFQKSMTYEWSMIRSTGVKDSDGRRTTEIICPKCGAKVQVNQTALCEFCGTLLTAGTFDWALNAITGLSQHIIK